MRRQIGVSGVAIAALMLAAAPAMAISLDLGGGSTSGSSSSAIGVNISGSGDLLNGSDTDALVDLGVNGGAKDGSSAILSGGRLVDLGEDGDADVNLDLFGQPGGAGQTYAAKVNLGDGGQDDVILDLFGGDGGSDATTAQVIFGGSRAAGSATDLAGDDAVMLDLFGTGGTDSVQTASIAPRSSTGADADNGGDGTEVFAPAAPGGTQPMPRPLPAGAGGLAKAGIATTGTVKCFSPDATQIDNLLGRTDYSVALTTSWKDADNVKLVPINLCAGARADLDAALAADANIGFLHSAVAGDAEITAALDPGYTPDDVLAVDQSGDELTVYVY